MGINASEDMDAALARGFAFETRPDVERFTGAMNSVNCRARSSQVAP
jgi:hypothetical protein